MLVARTPQQLAAALATLPHPALIPTMGALHEGHLALIAAAQAHGPTITSIFVNPTQFAPDEDFARYPRDEAGDLAKLAAAGCTLAWLPAATDLYPAADATRIEVAGPSLGYEGERRPGHFRGVATIVARLINLVAPATAWFGQKDWQQLQVIRRMAADLHLNTAIHDIPIQRAPDGLALSSRNRYLSPAERETAPLLARTGHASAHALAGGAPIAATLAAATRQLTQAGFIVEYFALVEAATMVELPEFSPFARLIAAARLGQVRLLDNFPA